MSKDYYLDVEMTNEIEAWMIEQGAVVLPSPLMPEVNYTGKPHMNSKDYMVFFGENRVHFWAGTNTARIFFNKENVSTALILLVKWPTHIGPQRKLPVMR